MSCASGRVRVTLILGCGSSIANASSSGVNANFLAIVSNGGASATSRRWADPTAWQVTHLASARRLPLSASAANAVDPRPIVDNIRQERSRSTECLLAFSLHPRTDGGVFH